MKKFLMISGFMLTWCICMAQLRILPGTQWINQGAAVIVFEDINLINDGTIIAGAGLAKFTGANNSSIAGNGVNHFNELEISKSANQKLFLETDIHVAKRVLFNTGLLDLNQHELVLAADGYLFNESESSRLTGINGGEVSITVNLNAPNVVNPGNLGTVISSAANMGEVVIKRGHKVQTGTGLPAAIQRYYNITPTNNVALNATFKSFYFDAEMNNQAEASLKMFRSTDGGVSWTNQNFTSRNLIENYVELTGVQAFSRWTLSSSGAVLPVLGLDFHAKRINNNLVQLNWKTNQEFNNKGFHVERKKENDNNFSTIGFVASLAAGGNSNQPLNYLKNDLNDFKGKTFYRLKQEDIDGKSIFSMIKLVTGSEEKTVSLKVWPVPSNGDVYMMLQGIDYTSMQVFDMKGRLVKQIPVIANTQQVIRGLTTGTYLLKPAGEKELVQKIIIQ